MQPAAYASYPFPFMAGNYDADVSVYNVNDFQYLLYRPLYWFGQGTTPYLNPALSLADLPVYHGQRSSSGSSRTTSGPTASRSTRRTSCSG